MTTVRNITFYKTNSVDDPGVTLSASDVAQRFWASDEAARWLENGDEMLARCAMRWITTELGGWGEDHTIWPAIEDAILEAKPEVPR